MYPLPNDAPSYYSELYEASNVKMASLPNKSLRVGVVVGIETDLPKGRDDYWRAGFDLPLQITQWTLASAPHHPIAVEFLSSVDKDVYKLMKENVLKDAYAVELTGPVQFTKVIKGWLETAGSLRWDALSGIEDGGKSKTVLDMLILPITGYR